jgi:hypothetical protein
VNHRILEKERKNIPAKMKAKENGKKKERKNKKRTRLQRLDLTPAVGTHDTS